MDELTERQTAILTFIGRHCPDNGYPPTVREIGLAVGLASPSTVHAHLAKLEQAGHIKRDPTKPRAMLVRVPGEGTSTPQPAAQPSVAALPLVGSVAAGAPTLAEQDVEDWVTSPFEGDFVLRVKGDSMIEAGILEGDIVVVRKQSDARAGEIVVALVGDDESADEATVKTFHREQDGRIRLQPENAALEPLFPEHVEILGKVTGVFRSLG